jgi:A/G-specific adenine glycosylase
VTATTPSAGPERDAAIARDLCAWFDGAARDLPWRRRREPYAVWLSEVMLQQTRVETVVPYFERFLARYPDVTALARADLDDVLSLWSGLGYYRRARELHLCAREVTERYGGALQADADRLRGLPGIGAYTAGAISSIAYGRREPLVDGNVARVLARLEGIEAPAGTAAGSKALWAAAARLVPASMPGKFNEALMELGATVCTPRDPRCDACPLRGPCVARVSGRQAELPVVTPKRKVPVVKMVAAVVGGGHRVLFARRAEGGLFGGLWEPPMVEAPSLARARGALAAVGVGATGIDLQRKGRVRHVLSHKELDVTVAAGEVREGEMREMERPRRGKKALAAPYERLAWLDPEAPGVGVSTLARKILAAARG